MAVLINEQIRASEVVLTGLRGEKLGIVSREEALAMARSAGADLVCTSLMSSPPPCSLTAKGKAKAAAQKEAASARKASGGSAAKGGSKEKVKELRFTAHIEEHDYDTKLRQAEKHSARQAGAISCQSIRCEGSCCRKDGTRTPRS